MAGFLGPPQSVISKLYQGNSPCGIASIELHYKLYTLNTGITTKKINGVKNNTWYSTCTNKECDDTQWLRTT